MLERLKGTMAGQVLLLVILTAASALFCFWGDFQPRLMMSSMKCLEGAIGGALTLATSLCFHLLLLLIIPEHTSRYLKEFSRQRGRLSWSVALGAVVVSATAEELFFRAYLFGYIAFFSLVAALAINLFAVFLCSLSSRREIPAALARGFEGSAVAVFYCYSHSLFSLAVARALFETAVIALARTSRLEHLSEIRFRKKHEGTRLHN